MFIWLLLGAVAALESCWETPKLGLFQPLRRQGAPQAFVFPFFFFGASSREEESKSEFDADDEGFFFFFPLWASFCSSMGIQYFGSQATPLLWPSQVMQLQPRPTSQGPMNPLPLRMASAFDQEVTYVRRHCVGARHCDCVRVPWPRAHEELEGLGLPAPSDPTSPPHRGHPYPD